MDINNDLDPLDNSKSALLRKMASVKESFEEKGANELSHPVNETYWALFEKSKNPLLMIDGSFRFIKCNDATLNLLGAVSKEQVINKPPSYFSPKYQPDGQLSAVKAAEMISSSLRKRAARI